MKILGTYWVKGATSWEFQWGHLMITYCFLTGGLWNYGLYRLKIQWVKSRPWTQLWPPEKWEMERHRRADQAFWASAEGQQIQQELLTERSLN